MSDGTAAHITSWLAMVVEEAGGEIVIEDLREHRGKQYVLATAKHGEHGLALRTVPAQIGSRN